MSSNVVAPRHTGMVRTYVLPVVATVLVLMPSLVAGVRGAGVSFLLALAVAFLGARSGHARTGLLVAGVVATVNLILAAVHLHAGNDGPIVLVQAALFAALTGAIGATLESLRRSEAALRQDAWINSEVSSGFQIGVCGLDGTGRIQTMNANAERILRQGIEDLRGHHWDELVRQPEWRTGRTSPSESQSAVLATEEAEIVTPQGTIRVAYLVTSVRKGIEKSRVVSFIDVTRSHRAIGDLTQQEQRYRRVFDLAPDGIVATDREGRIVLANCQMAQLWGIDQSENLAGMRLADLLTASEIEPGMLAPAGDNFVESIGLRTDGTPFSVEIHSRPTPGDPVVSHLHVFRDTSAQSHDREQLIWRDSSAAFQHAISDALAQAASVREATRDVLAAAGDYGQWDVGIAWVRLEGTGLLQAFSVWHSPSFDDIGFAAISQEIAVADGEDLPGRAWQQRSPVWEPDIRSDVAFSRRLVALKAGLRSGFAVPICTGARVHMVLEFFSRRAQEPSQSYIDVMMSAARYFAQFYERASAQEALEHQALHDTLTDLPNRVLLQQRVERAIDSARERQSSVGLLLMDLDRFKEVNDTLGHAYGDVLLRQVSDRLRICLDESVTVARLGGDEFAVLLPSGDENAALHVADRLLEALQRPYMLADQQVIMGASVGIALYPDHGDGVHTLLRHADVAMYQAKRAQSGRVVYQASDDEHTRERLTTMAELAAAIRDGRLNLFYQPKLAMKTGRVEAVEGLVRWHHPQRGLLQPDDFIPLAEQAGLIKDLLRCVLTIAVRQCSLWQRSGIDLGVAVNVSPQLLHDVTLPLLVRNVLAEYDVAPECLTLEITESILMANADRTMDTLSGLHDLGVRISVDDFGTGYSSLSYLTRLPLDELKIDKSFVHDLNDRADNGFVAQSIVDLGHNLGLEIVAEGVETSEVLAILERIGCDQVQGYYISEPLAATDFISWYESLAFDEDSNEGGAGTVRMLPDVTGPRRRAIAVERPSRGA